MGQSQIKKTESRMRAETVLTRVLGDRNDPESEAHYWGQLNHYTGTPCDLAGPPSNWDFMVGKIAEAAENILPVRGINSTAQLRDQTAVLARHFRHMLTDSTEKADLGARINDENKGIITFEHDSVTPAKPIGERHGDIARTLAERVILELQDPDCQRLLPAAIIRTSR